MHNALLADLDLYIGQNTRITSPKTVAHYKICFRQFAQDVQAMKPADVNDLNVTKFLRMCRDVRQLAPHTVCQKYDYLRAYATDRAKRGLIPWLTVAPPKRPVLVPTALSQQELRDLFVSAKRESPWWHALVYWFWVTAERTEATLTGARWSGVHGDTIVIGARYRKGRGRPGVYRLPQDLMCMLDGIRTERDEIFHWDKSVSCFYLHWKALYEGSGLTHVPHKTGPHQLRRSHASWLEANGGNATESLGHSSRRVTTLSYIDPRVVKRPDYAARLPAVG